MAYTSIQKPAEIFYWHKESRNSNAEVDFIFIRQGHITPVEVKAARRGKLKSLLSFLESHPNTNYGVKISQEPFNLVPPIFSIPFFAIKYLLEKVN